MIRNDFVSNSSSSSFIVIAKIVSNKEMKKTQEEVKNIKKILLPAKYGTYCFGWEHKVYDDIWSKLNFCAIQLHDLKRCDTSKKNLSKMPKYYREFYEKYTFDKCLKLFKNVCKDHLNLDVDIKLEYNEDEEWDYVIDHQSSVIEARNMNMFKDKQTLYNFLLTSESYIQGGNDNDPY